MHQIKESQNNRYVKPMSIEQNTDRAKKSGKSVMVKGFQTASKTSHHRIPTLSKIRRQV